MVKHSLSLTQKLSYSMPNFALNVAGNMLGMWLVYFYRPPDEQGGLGSKALISAFAFSAIMFIGQIVGALTDPIVGHWSDRIKTRLGRRLPFMLFGTPFLAIFFAAIWFPCFEPGSPGNIVYLSLTYIPYVIFFSVVLAPYFSLLPEIAPEDNERVVLASVMAVCMVPGLILGACLPGLFQESFKNGGIFLGLYFENSYQIAAVIAAVIVLVFFFMPFINIRESPDSKAKSVPSGLIKNIKSAFHNPAFPTYLGMCSLTMMGLGVLVAALPYLTTQILERPKDVDGIIQAGHGEEWAIYIFAGIIIMAALVIPFISFLSRKFGKKRLFLYAGSAFGMILILLSTITLWDDPAIPAFALFILLPFPVGITLVLPNAIYADVVDYDEKLTGYRREGLYNGATSIMVKLAQGLSPAIVVGLLTFGDNRANPLGIYLTMPCAGIFVLTGVLIFRKHLIEK